MLFGLSCSAVHSYGHSSKPDDLAKIDGGFFVSKKEVEGVQDQVFREELTHFLKEKGLLTKSSKALIYYYISEDAIAQIEDLEFKNRLREFVTEPLDRAIVFRKPVVRVYEVQTGDTLWEIAEKFGMSLDELLFLNKLIRTRSIYPGQKLFLAPNID